MKTAVYAGSFDPVTNGHLWIIAEGARLFDRLYVGVGTNPEKIPTFSSEERLAMLRESVDALGYKNVVVQEFLNKYQIHYAKSVGAQYLLRGQRNILDFVYETDARYDNEALEPSITTYLLIPPYENCRISSKKVKGFVGPENWESLVRKYVPEPVFKKLVDWHAKRSIQ